MSAKNVFTFLGVFVAIWAVLGFLDVGNFTTSGYTTDFDNNVTTVTQGGAADAAGMEVGDAIRSIDGIDITDARALSSQGRPSVGQVQSIVVDRDGETHELSLTQAALSSSQRANSYIGILIGLAFAGMGLWAFLTAPGRASHVLAKAGILLAIPFVGGPYLGASTLANLVGALTFLCIVLGFAALLHFMIVFPSGSDPDKKKVYGPAILVGLFIVALNLFQPDATSGLNRFVQLVFIAWIVGYLGLALVKMIKTWSAASAEDRDRHGLNTLLIGTGLGLGILLLSAVIGIVFPTVTFPGQQWLTVTLVLVPISCALAAVKSARAAEPAAPAAPA